MEVVPLLLQHYYKRQANRRWHTLSGWRVNAVDHKPPLFLKKCGYEGIFGVIMIIDVIL